MVVASVGRAAAPSPVLGAQTALTFTSASTWTADPEAARVHVAVLITATSHTPDVEGPRYYYDSLQLTVPQGSTKFAATAAGEPVPLSILATSQSGVVLAVSLGQRLYSGQTGRLYLTFDLVDPGGSTDRDFRFGRNLMSFPVSAFGSPGMPGSTVTVDFPSDFTIQEEFGGLTRVTTGSDAIVFTSGPIEDSTALNAWFTAVKPVPPSEIGVRLVTIGPLSVSLRYWADDQGWADQVERVLRSAYPVLRDLIGLGDPNATTFDIEEASSQQIGGFSGAYDQSHGLVSISYFADPFVIVHEAAHLWFNSDLSSERWIDEGFASYYAQQTLDKLGLVGHGPLLTSQLRKAAMPLGEWNSAGDPNSAADGYLYGASFEVAGQIAAVAGQAGLRSVWAAARSGSDPYPSNVEPSSGAARGLVIDSRSFLDLLETTTGRSFVSLWRSSILSAAEGTVLDQRSAVRDQYEEARIAAAPWSLPPDLRASMDAWKFDDAASLLFQVRVILDRRTEIAAESAAEGTRSPPTLRNAFETEATLSAVSESLSELATLSELTQARLAGSSGDGVTRVLGLIGTDPQANLAEARVAFGEGDLARSTSLAAAARSSWDNASNAGGVRAAGGLLVLAGLLLLVIVLVSTRLYRSPSDVGAGHEAEVDVGSAATNVAPVWNVGPGQDDTPATAGRHRG